MLALQGTMVATAVSLPQFARAACCYSRHYPLLIERSHTIARPYESCVGLLIGSANASVRRWRDLIQAPIAALAAVTATSAAGERLHELNHRNHKS